MGNSRVTNKIKLSTVDELLGVPKTCDETVLIEIDRIKSFKDHPFKVLDDERMDDLVDSIRTNGILNPIIVRPMGSGRYEMISGHRRLRASKHIGLETIPAISKQLSDEEAIIMMVDSNIQREELLPSEKARALKMRYDAIKKQGYRSDLTLCTECTKLDERTSDSIGGLFGIKGRQVNKYIRLTYLSEELLSLVDKKNIGINIAAEISYFDATVQEWIYQYVRDNGFIKLSQVEALKNYPARQINGHSTFIDIMIDALPHVKNDNLVLSMKKLDRFFSENISKDKRINIILKLLSDWYEREDDINLKAEKR